jgi:phosphoribosyl-dephospho-CoA transferase
MQKYDRHTLLDINHEGRTKLFIEAEAKGYNRETCGALLLPEEFPTDIPGANKPGAGSGVAVPGIVRREDYAPRPDAIAVGFTSWTSGPMGRLRLPGFVSPQYVERSRDPITVLNEAFKRHKRFVRTPALRALTALHSSELQEAHLGVWGSAGLELATGYEYTHERSDLDFLIHPQSRLTFQLLTAWLDTVLMAERRFQIRIDAEIHLANGYGVSLKECLKGTSSVLGKGINDVKLVSMNEVCSDNNI